MLISIKFRIVGTDIVYMGAYYSELYTYEHDSAYEQNMKFSHFTGVLVTAEIFALFIFLCRMMQCIKILKKSYTTAKH